MKKGMRQMMERMAGMMLMMLVPMVALGEVKLFPENGSREVNPDTQLRMEFDEEVQLGERGCIRVYDKATGKLVDMLDMSIAAGPTERTPDAPGADYIKVPYSYESKVITRPSRQSCSNGKHRAGCPNVSMPRPSGHR